MKTLRIREYIESLQRFYERVEREVKERFNGRIVCEQGCSYCCCNTECYALPVESAHVVLFLNESLTSELRRRLAGRIERFRSNYREHVAKGTIVLESCYFPDFSSKVRAMGIRCPFLSDGNDCIIYPVRPLICRTYVSYPAQECTGGQIPSVMQSRDFSVWLSGMMKELESINRAMLFKIGVLDRTCYISLLPLMLRLEGDMFVTGIAENRLFHIRRSCFQPKFQML